MFPEVSCSDRSEDRHICACLTVLIDITSRKPLQSSRFLGQKEAFYRLGNRLFGCALGCRCAYLLILKLQCVAILIDSVRAFFGAEMDHDLPPGAPAKLERSQPLSEFYPVRS